MKERVLLYFRASNFIFLTLSHYLSICLSTCVRIWWQGYELTNISEEGARDDGDDLHDLGALGLDDDDDGEDDDLDGNMFRRRGQENSSDEDSKAKNMVPVAGVPDLPAGEGIKRFGNAMRI